MLLNENTSPDEKTLFQVDWRFFSNKVLEKMRVLARKKDLDLKIYLAARESLLPIKTKHLEYLLTELVDNAMKFSYPNSEVFIFLQNTPHYLLLRVKDQGIGMPFEILPQVFDKFFQYKPDLERGPGAGLGLSIVKGITGIYRGHIKIVTNPGTGTEVELRFRRTSRNNASL